MEADNGQQQQTTNISAEALNRLYAELGSKTHAVYELQAINAKLQAEAQAEVYYVKWIAPPLKFGVIRRADKAVIKDGFTTKAEAVVWMQQNAKSA